MFFDLHRAFLAAALPQRVLPAGGGNGPVPVRLAIISEGVNTWPLYVAQGKEFFKRHGLEVDVTLTGSSVMQLEKLCAGGFDIGFQQSDHVVRAVEKGADLFIFMAMAHAPGLTLVTAPEIRSFDDLRGKIIAVDGARTGYALLLRRLLKDHGLAEGDCTFQEVGGSQERFDALKSGVAVASLLNPPFDKRLLAEGFGSLGAINDFFPDYPGPIAGARRAWAAAHRGELVAFIRAFNDAYAWLQQPENAAEAVSLLPRRLNIDPKAAERALAEMLKRPQPVIREQSLPQVIDIVWDAEGFSGPRGAPEKYLDLAYWTEARREA